MDAVRNASGFKLYFYLFILYKLPALFYVHVRLFFYFNFIRFYLIIFGGSFKGS